ncbi:hypothetical protein LXL04_009706 [Taraxacum kok-saghyz]
MKLHVEYGGIKSVPNQPNKSSSQNKAAPSSSNALVLSGTETSKKGDLTTTASAQPKNLNLSTAALMERIPSRWPRPAWHAPWKNYRVISGHLGWVRSIAFDPSNQWFCTGLAVSTRHTYMFSAGDDKLVKCWDLEKNKVIRLYHRHLSGVYCLALHPTINVLLTGGRDSVCGGLEAVLDKDENMSIGQRDALLLFRTLCKIMMKLLQRLVFFLSNFYKDFWRVLVTHSPTTSISLTL